MVEIERSVVVRLPAARVYEQWTQFESYPAFMDRIWSVQQFGDAHLRVGAGARGGEKRWDVELVALVPERKLAWRRTGDGPGAQGWLVFRPLDDRTTRVDAHLEVDDTVDRGFLDSLVARTLGRFRMFVESRGAVTAEHSS